MKTFILFCMIAMVNSCQTEHVGSHKGLIGTWAPTYEIRNKNELGIWEEWSTINTFVALPSITFTKDGKLLSDGKPSESCCSFNSYTVNENYITLTGLVTCPNVKCKICPEWKIIKLEENILELQICENTQHRYQWHETSSK